MSQGFMYSEEEIQALFEDAFENCEDIFGFPADWYRRSGFRIELIEYANLRQTILGPSGNS
jgi:hypothetical protein